MSQQDREKWDARYQKASGPPSEPSSLLTRLEDILPRRGTALDVAGGTGRNAVWLAKRGLDVTLADISPLGIELAGEHAQAKGVDLATVQIDLELEPFPTGPWDVIISFFFLRRSLFSEFAKTLRPGGWLVYLQPTRRNLERHAKPPEGFLLDDGELPSLVGDLEVIRYEEGWLEEGRHDAFLLARRKL